MSNDGAALGYVSRNWAQIAMVLGGIALVFTGAWVGQRYDIVHRLTLEATGERGVATAEPLTAGEYRLRLALDTSIYSRSYRGNLRGGDSENNAEFSVPVVFDRADPMRFMPAGQSYIPAIISGLLFLAGMTCVLLARRTAVAAQRIQRLSRLKAEEERKRKKHAQKHRSHRHGTSNRPA